MPQVTTFAIRGPLARADLPALYERFCDMLHASDADVVLCDVGGIAPDAVAIDALARMQLAAQRNRCQVRLRNASLPLLQLVGFMGLSDVLPDGR
ncbi:STAS domain-containing protein [Conexibacter woesei]|nr:STAS domain-containing protein [Conexibacter woesei]